MINSPNQSISLFIDNNEQFSFIEHLHINHCFTLEKLYRIVSYILKLRGLRLLDIYDINLNIKIISSLALSNRICLLIKCTKFNI